MRGWAKRIMIGLGILVLLSVGLALVFSWASGPGVSAGLQQGEVYDYGEAAAAARDDDPTKLVVLTWNIAWAHGSDSDLSRNVVPPRQQFEQHLMRMGQWLRQQQADVVLLQEIDFGAKRSQYLDQLALLAQASGLRYGARAVSWDARYVPFPYWPPQQHYGRMLSGGAVLSRFPIVQQRVVVHPKPADQPWWYKAFYLSRYTQQVQLERAGGHRFWVVNNHLEAWDKPNRQAQARRLVHTVAELAALAHRSGEDGVWLVGGDMNTVAPEATKKSGFSDDPEDNYEADGTLALLRGMAGLREIVPTERYLAAEQAHFTFPSTAPSRRLDYLFVPTTAVVANYAIAPVSEFSDHRPVRAELHLTVGLQQTRHEL